MSSMNLQIIEAVTTTTIIGSLVVPTKISSPLKDMVVSKAKPHDMIMLQRNLHVLLHCWCAVAMKPPCLGNVRTDPDSKMLVLVFSTLSSISSKISKSARTT
ncbi:hypothetical protein VNO77_37164 [Canavalia gladiata]|uniref:Uncharacterized protein n=1 Tax=Canavalia gladiata TaxID=3824 RepID=A0AAN9PWZ6_CANGL